MWSELIHSKKFKMAVFAILAVVCSALAEQMAVEDAINNIIIIVGTYLGAQGLADFGKSTHQDAAARNQTTDDTVK